jgi:hypothetical protein
MVNLFKISLAATMQHKKGRQKHKKHNPEIKGTQKTSPKAQRQ